VEELGLLKMDFLGLRNLGDYRPTRSISSNRATESGFDIDHVPLDDHKAVFALVERATPIGVFQLEGTPMRALMRKLGPTIVRRCRRPRRALSPGTDGGETFTTTTPTARTDARR
jgi:DNA polymerase-3 subunit alpha